MILLVNSLWFDPSPHPSPYRGGVLRLFFPAKLSCSPFQQKTSSACPPSYEDDALPISGKKVEITRGETVAKSVQCHVKPIVAEKSHQPPGKHPIRAQHRERAKYRLPLKSPLYRRQQYPKCGLWGRGDREFAR